MTSPSTSRSSKSFRARLFREVPQGFGNRLGEGAVVTREGKGILYLSPQPPLKTPRASEIAGHIPAACRRGAMGSLPSDHVVYKEALPANPRRRGPQRSQGGMEGATIVTEVRARLNRGG